MIDTTRLLAFCAAAFVVIAIPGPSVLFVIGRGVSLGRRAALLTVLANSVGVYMLVLLDAVGQHIAPKDTRTILREGFTVGLLNPKAALRRSVPPAAES